MVAGFSCKDWPNGRTTRYQERPALVGIKAAKSRPFGWNRENCGKVNEEITKTILNGGVPACDRTIPRRIPPGAAQTLKAKAQSTDFHFIHFMCFIHFMLLIRFISFGCNCISCKMLVNVMPREISRCVHSGSDARTKTRSFAGINDLAQLKSNMEHILTVALHNTVRSLLHDYSAYDARGVLSSHHRNA